LGIICIIRVFTFFFLWFVFATWAFVAPCFIVILQLALLCVLLIVWIPRFEPEIQIKTFHSRWCSDFILLRLPTLLPALT
jgi:hypothetical protein